MRTALCAFCLALAPGLQAQVRINLAPTACPPARAPAAVAGQALPPLPHLGLALGSGSLHGIAHIGVLQELEARGVDAKVVAGTSAGALIGALWASGVTAVEIGRMQRLEDFEEMGSFSWSRGGIFTNERVRERLDKVFGARPIESWPRRFGAVATDIASGERVVLARGSGALAVQASTAIPAFYAPVMIDGRRLADGALVEPVPVDTARELGAAFVIAIDVAYRPREDAAVSATQLAFQAMHVLTNTLAGEQMKRADVAVSIDLHETFMKCGRAALVAAGREAVRAAWPAILRQAARGAAR